MDDFEQEFHGMGITEAAYFDDEVGNLDAVAPGWDVWPNVNNGATWGEEAPQDAESMWTETRTEEPEKPLCSVHGVICKKGICQEYAKQARQAKRDKALEEAKGEKGKKRSGRGGGSRSEGRGRGRGAAQSNPFHRTGAPVKTNWLGVPRQIVSPDTIKEREGTESVDESVMDGWGDDGGGDEPEQHEEPAAEVASSSGWGVSEQAFDPWAVEVTDTKQKKPDNRNNARGKPKTWRSRMNK